MFVESSESPAMMRTLGILNSLDDMLDDAAHGIDKDPYLFDKLTYKLKWITRYLDLQTIEALIDEHKFRNAEAMKKLLNDPTFNVKIGH